MNRNLFCWLLLCLSPVLRAQDLPDTGISGVYEVMMGVADADYARRYFAEFGFTVVDSAAFTEAQARTLYGVPSALTAYRLQNGEVDSHGLLRLLVWAKPLGPGVGYSAPETIGSRMSVMMTSDIMRLYDIYLAARNGKEPWLPTEPVADDLFGLNKADANNFFKRPVLVRENAVYGDFFNHVFFQRYGYTIPGYGTINPAAPLKTSEFTHHDFIIKVDDMRQLDYLRTALGLQPEKEPEIDGDWLAGPRRVFLMEPGYSHWYQGFVSPNNICGKLKFFMPRGPKPDRSAHQRVGELGITLHSFYTPKLQMVHALVQRHGLSPTSIQANEFGEQCFVFKGPEGAVWQIIEKTTTRYQPIKKLEFFLVNE